LGGEREREWGTGKWNGKGRTDGGPRPWSRRVGVVRGREEMGKRRDKL